MCLLSLRFFERRDDFFAESGAVDRAVCMYVCTVCMYVCYVFYVCMYVMYFMYVCICISMYMYKYMYE